MTKHSGGIWIDGVPIEDAQSVQMKTIVSTETGELVCTIAPGKRAEANADLIMASPRMLALLRNILTDLPSKRDWLDPSVEAEAKAIVKAFEDTSENKG